MEVVDKFDEVEVVDVVHVKEMVSTAGGMMFSYGQIVGDDDPIGTLYMYGMIVKFSSGINPYVHNKRVLPSDPIHLFYRTIAWNSVPNVQRVRINEGRDGRGEYVIKESSESDMLRSWYDCERGRLMLDADYVPKRPPEYESDDDDWSASWRFWMDIERRRISREYINGEWVSVERGGVVGVYDRYVSRRRVARGAAAGGASETTSRERIDDAERSPCPPRGAACEPPHQAAAENVVNVSIVNNYGWLAIESVTNDSSSEGSSASSASASDSMTFASDSSAAFKSATTGTQASEFTPDAWPIDHFDTPRKRGAARAGGSWRTFRALSLILVITLLTCTALSIYNLLSI